MQERRITPAPHLYGVCREQSPSKTVVAICYRFRVAHAALELGMNPAPLFRRDLRRLRKQLKALPSDELLWKGVPGITNPIGNLVLHLEGNLREYIGHQLGQCVYNRQREAEFTATSISKEELIVRVDELLVLIPAIVAVLSVEQMNRPYPEDVLGTPLCVGEFLIHLYGHLNWHLGQIDYLRRALTGEGAIPAIGLDK